MERTTRHPGGHKPGGLTSSTFANIERVIANHGSITIGDISADIGCVAAAADPHLCYAMLLRRDGESLLELMGRLDRAIKCASESSITVDEVNPPGGFKPPAPRPSQDGVERTVTHGRNALVEQAERQSLQEAMR